MALTSGTLNTFVGAHAGETGDLVGLTGCTLIGAQSQCAAGLINATAIGFQATVNTDDSLVLGKTGTNVGIGNSKAQNFHSMFWERLFPGNYFRIYWNGNFKGTVWSSHKRSNTSLY